MSKSSSKGRKRSSNSGTSGITRSSPYSRDFEQKLVDEGIYPAGYTFSDDEYLPAPENLGDIRRTLAQPRPSLSPSQFPDKAVSEFERDGVRALREKNVMARVVETIAATVARMVQNLKWRISRGLATSIFERGNKHRPS